MFLEQIQILPFFKKQISSLLLLRKKLYEWKNILIKLTSIIIIITDGQRLLLGWEEKHTM